MSGIKNIETVYNSYRFRSRLEARFAIVFDTLGIPYQYELQGYDISGTWYLPDFYLPQQQCWFEVKGEKSVFERGTKNYQLYHDFAESIGPIVVFTNPCIPGTKFVLEDAYSSGGVNDGEVDWYHCPTFGFQLSLRDSLTYTIYADGYDRKIDVCAKCEWHTHNPVHSRIQAAKTAGRQARFEYGENPLAPSKRYDRRFRY